MRIEVTQEDIDKGRACACNLCPVALAIKRVLGLEHGVLVGTETVSVLGRGTANLPRPASVFINNFDNQQDVKPFAFDLYFKPFAFDLYFQNETTDAR